MSKPIQRRTIEELADEASCVLYITARCDGLITYGDLAAAIRVDQRGLARVLEEVANRCKRAIKPIPVLTAFVVSAETWEVNAEGFKIVSDQPPGVVRQEAVRWARHNKYRDIGDPSHFLYRIGLDHRAPVGGPVVPVPDPEPTDPESTESVHACGGCIEDTVVETCKRSVIPTDEDAILTELGQLADELVEIERQRDWLYTRRRALYMSGRGSGITVKAMAEAARVTDAALHLSARKTAS